MAKAKSVTFRCTEKQHRRLEEALMRTGMNRTQFIEKALREFLEFAEQEDIRKLDLFALVEAVDALGAGVTFEDMNGKSVT